MKGCSFKAVAAVAFLHIAASTWLVSAALSRIHAYDHRETLSWLTIVAWIWMLVPVSLSRHFHFGPAGYFYYLALPWSLFVGVCCGFIVPYFSRWRHRLA